MTRPPARAYTQNSHNGIQLIKFGMSLNAIMHLFRNFKSVSWSKFDKYKGVFMQLKRSVTPKS